MKLCLVAALAVFLVGCASSPPTQSVNDLRMGAESGDVDAMFDLALRLDGGHGWPMDRREAARWYLKAAQAGHAGAQNSIGSMYQAGDGVELDHEEAFRWYRAGADQGHLEATHNLAYLYDEVLSPTDKGKALELYEIAARRGFAKSMLNLGIMHSNGDGVPLDRVKGYMWLDLARFYTQRSKDMQLKWHIREILDQLKKEMSTGEIRDAEGLAREWQSTNQSG